MFYSFLLCLVYSDLRVLPALE
uniref:Uncharacterized protein n=1 Tax=Arundo donax TaxID=35708 RepID=A0A0A9EYW7_ARUDO